MERSPLQHLAYQYREPDFDLIEPGSAGRGKVEMDVLMPGQPAVAFRLMGVEIIKNDMDFAALIGLDDAVHEVEELDAPTASEYVSTRQSWKMLRRSIRQPCSSARSNPAGFVPEQFLG